MSDLESFLTEIREILGRLRDGVVRGEEFVNRYDDLMADELPDELDQSGTVYQLLDHYHTEFAMYVENSKWRDEYPDDYYGPEDLRRKAQSLLEALDRVQKKDGQ